MCSYKNRELAVTKNIVLLQDRQLQQRAITVSLHPKYMQLKIVLCLIKLLLFAVTNRKFDSYKIAKCAVYSLLSVAVTCTYYKAPYIPIRLPTATSKPHPYFTSAVAFY